jgi:hypothetical protein
MNRSVNACRISRVMGVLPGLLIAAVLGLGLAGPLLAGQAPKVLPRKSLPYGKTYGEWSASWWQWALQLPLTGHPFNDDPAFDFTSGQLGDVWFMSGAYGTVSRNVTLPSGKTLFIGMIDAEASDLEGLGSTEAERRASAEFFADHIVTSTLSCTIDGSAVANITAYRVSSPEFSFTAPSPWIFGATGGQGLAVADGYYLMLAPLSVGAHTIHFTGAFHFAIAEGDPFDLDLPFDDTYNVSAQ